jgi:hypothetical protein
VGCLDNDAWEAWIEDPYTIIEENPSKRRAPVSVRVDDMFDQIKEKLPGVLRFLLCLLPERENCKVGYVLQNLLQLQTAGVVHLTLNLQCYQKCGCGKYM